MALPAHSRNRGKLVTGTCWPSCMRDCDWAHRLSGGWRARPVGQGFSCSTNLLPGENLWRVCPDGHLSGTALCAFAREDLGCALSAFAVGQCWLAGAPPRRSCFVQSPDSGLLSSSERRLRLLPYCMVTRLLFWGSGIGRYQLAGLPKIAKSMRFNLEWRLSQVGAFIKYQVD